MIPRDFCFYLLFITIKCDKGRIFIISLLSSSFQSCNMEAFRKWHSKHNLLWLSSENHTNNYSSFQSWIACLHPIIVVLSLILYITYFTIMHEGDSQHFVTFKVMLSFIYRYTAGIYTIYDFI